MYPILWLSHNGLSISFILMFVAKVTERNKVQWEITWRQNAIHGGLGRFNGTISKETIGISFTNVIQTIHKRKLISDTENSWFR